MAQLSDEPIRVLFLCIGNSARSQMAEAFLRRYRGGRFAAYSAGTELSPEINLLAIEAMRQISSSMDSQYPKTLDWVMATGITWDYVITACNEVEEDCPTFPGDTERIHWNFDDPSKAEGTHEERLRVFRRIRDEIKRRVQLFTELSVHHRAGASA
jgi:arsenate reductase